MSITFIPQNWIDVLTKVQEVFPQAKIAGGALRDLEYNREVKDVDIFIPVSRDSSMNKVQQEVELIKAISKLDDHMNVLMSPVIPIYFKDMNQEMLESGRWVESVHAFNIDGTQYEVIFCAEETCDINKFDFSICQISFDGKMLIKTPEYIRTAITNVITYNNDFRNPLRAKDRIARMRSKFPDMEVKVEEVQTQVNPFKGFN